MYTPPPTTTTQNTIPIPYSPQQEVEGIIK